ncbi:hypothetical protein THAOC_19026 [Thalassiosira oceanica]|uniref:Pre-mRNA 3'-end-processing endonuclease polyadenylation factor C-term domain-containing protein n=1 Tax=Thalassiosira oceanica TaxID=159749 RepID=K0S6P8_THAOC|nr:hypothetical protein THAOC_19026 [Thalassiosira oceanica]|eukprot:EJK60589.1 hypothetical protein THAOC_19026 [Thalassiosira oceanica]
MPPNEVDVKLIFTRRRSAKVMGKLAEVPPTDLEDDEEERRRRGSSRAVEPREGDSVRGILVTQQDSSRIVAPEDLSTYTPLRVGSVSSRLHVPFVGKVETLRMFLGEMFRGIEETSDPSGGEDDGDAGVGQEGVVTFAMHGGQVKVVVGQTRGVVTVEWDCSAVGDVVADSVVALIMHAQSSAASVRLTAQACGHRRKRPREGEDLRAKTEEYLRTIHEALRMQYLSVEATYEARKGTFEIRIDADGDGVKREGGVGDDDSRDLTCTAEVIFEDDFGTAKISVESEDEKLATNVRTCLANLAEASAAVSTV